MLNDCFCKYLYRLVGPIVISVRSCPLHSGRAPLVHYRLCTAVLFCLAWKPKGLQRFEIRNDSAAFSMLAAERKFCFALHGSPRGFGILKLTLQHSACLLPSGNCAWSQRELNELRSVLQRKRAVGTAPCKRKRQRQHSNKSVCKA